MLSGLCNVFSLNVKASTIVAVVFICPICNQSLHIVIESWVPVGISSLEYSECKVVRTTRLCSLRILAGKIA